jgi:signal transduction histidine kinase
MSAVGTTSTIPDRRSVRRAVFAVQIALLVIVITLAVSPWVDERRWPGSPGEWTTPLASVAAAALAAYLYIAGSLTGRRHRRRHNESEDVLRIALRKGAAGDEALRVSTERRKFGARRLRTLVARGLVGDENLRVAVASGLVGDENLRVAVASGAITDEKLRVSVAAGAHGAEALRVSVAEGIQGAEALRISIAKGIDAASTTLAVVDTVDAAITLYAPDGHIMLTNDTARALAALARTGELDPLEFADDRVTPIPVPDQVLARAARGQLVTRRAYWVGTGEAQRAIMSTSQYVRRASGELIGTVVASHDVTPLARTRDEFLETVSHELRTPLTSMVGYLDIIEESLDLEDTGIAHEFEIIQRNTDRLLTLINDLLLTAQGEPPTDRRPFDVGELAENSLNSIRQRAEATGLRLTLTSAVSVIADVDADRIGDALDKVLSNAVKFNRPDGRIDVTVASDETSAIVTISDTGVGMVADDRLRVFERFYRAPSARAGALTGVGLGLSAAKIIVDAHDGTITCASTLGAGTAIEIRLPLVAGAPHARILP